jgi:hypothetical protein
MGVTTIFCCADMVSQGFWLKQASEKVPFQCAPHRFSPYLYKKENRQVLCTPSEF